MPIFKPRKKSFNPLVVALMYDGFCVFEFACVAEVFGLHRPEAGPHWYRFETCSLSGRSVTGQYGTRMQVDGDAERLLAAGTILVPGWRDYLEPPPEHLLKTLRQAHEQGARIVSICSGAFVLAASGLLNGGSATTHWRYKEEFERRFPHVTFDPNVLYTGAGRVLTSAGSAAGIDMCLHLVRSDFGAAAANLVAKRLVVAPHREGGQSQFVVAPVDRRETGGLGAVIDRIRRHLKEPLSIEIMARWAATSPRSFSRRFHHATGASPGEWVIAERVNQAKRLLEESSLGLEAIASEVGIGSATNLRHQFRKRLGLSPMTYRRRFSA
ncbi:transcriptional regulator FtrA [Ahniella affigens]|uniref:Transcriptional regulator FtrA n=1 Tax=Ahniella affigens TaxID=2021234 RepID=A0A2P1PMJ8_9GAMM|nr:transcriptional regulator FtrA [Ahniella affigens]AVP96068.1 transcriptional regulator FtrA [Ahniella affigens]